MGTSRSGHLSSLSGSSAHEAQSPIPSATEVEKAQYRMIAEASPLSRPRARTSGTIEMAEKIVKKAKSNSTHTDITETIAPGKLPA